MPERISRPLIRTEDIIALMMIIPSLWVTSPSEYYSLLNGSIILSKHATGLLLLFIFAILAALYQNRMQRIIDTIKSGVKIPEVTIQDQFVHLWKTKFNILYVIRDYLPFLLCIIAYQKLVTLVPHVPHQGLDKIFLHIDAVVVQEFRHYILSKVGHYRWFNDLLHLSYKTHILAVPFVAIYLYIFKEYSKFRGFLLSIVVALILSLVVDIFFPSIGMDIYTKKFHVHWDGTISIPALYTAVVLVYSFKVGKTLTSFFIPVALVLFLSDILSFSNYFSAIMISIIVALISVPLSSLLMWRSRT